jgi:peptidoglycan biosynthesis protein MviN/MurJ (putative lipid II flippase)
MRKNKRGSKRGQVTIVNLIGVLITLVLYFKLVTPLLSPMIADAVEDLEADPNDFTDITVALLYAVPFLLLLSIVLTAINYAIPQTENRGGYG